MFHTQTTTILFSYMPCLSQPPVLSLCGQMPIMIQLHEYLNFDDTMYNVVPCDYEYHHVNTSVIFIPPYTPLLYN